MKADYKFFVLLCFLKDLSGRRHAFRLSLNFRDCCLLLEPASEHTHVRYNSKMERILYINSRLKCLLTPPSHSTASLAHLERREYTECFEKLIRVFNDFPLWLCCQILRKAAVFLSPPAQIVRSDAHDCNEMRWR
jgi:hypothetical protein